MREALLEAQEQVRDRLRRLGSCVVAFSGGVDSALVLKVAADVLGKSVVALTAVSPSMPKETLSEAAALVEELGVQWRRVASNELADPQYAQNPANRCYFCKRELYRLCQDACDALGISAMVDGLNADDLQDHRPGRAAAQERSVCSPLAEAGLTKVEVRAWSKALGLQGWDRPAMPCLASRIPYGTSVTEGRLRQIGSAETALRELGLREFRVRYHGETARLEVSAEELHRFVDPAFRDRALEVVLASGFERAVVDPEPFRSGRLNVFRQTPSPVP
ncbi:MAG: ATP-dependent sacrificial sulfur transferase LarE [Myxococcaceae bacterium]